VSGRQVIAQGKHAQQEAIAMQFVQVMQTLEQTEAVRVP
jgi:hypothetical protein